MTIYRGDFTHRDAASIRSELMDFLTREYPTVALDLDEDSISLESILLDPIVRSADGLHLYIDAAYSEAFIDTAVEPQSLHSHAKLAGYPMGRRSAPTAELTYLYTKDDPGAPASLFLVLGQAMPNSSGFTWTVVNALQNVVEGIGTFEVKQGSFVVDIYTATAAPDQVYTITRQNVASNVSPSVKVASVAWTIVDNIARAGAGQYVEIKWLGNGKFCVKFGDGANGDVPSGSIAVTSFITDGVTGNVPKNTITGEFKPDSDVTLTYDNESPVYDGSDGDDVKTARKNIPAFGFAQDRECSIDDYKALIESQAGVKYVNFLFDESLGKVVAYVLSSAWGEMTTKALANLARTIRGKEMFFTSLVFKNVDIASAIVSIKVVFDRSSRLDTEMHKSIISDTVEDFFQPPDGQEITNEVGKTIRLSDFFRMLDAVEGVSHLNVDVFTRLPELKAVDWTTGVTGITLDGWNLRPTTMTFGTLGMSGGLIESIGTLVDSTKARVKRTVNVIEVASMLKKVGVRATTDDWSMRASAACPDKVKITMSEEYRNYVWPSWYDGNNEVPAPLADDLETRTTSRTAHFAVVHEVDNTNYSDSAVGYLDVPYELDGGWMMFKLTAGVNSVNDSGTFSGLDSGYAFLDLSYGQIKVGTVSGYVVIGGTNVVLSDDSTGGMQTVSGERVGYIDYDTGWLVMENSLLSVAECTVTLSYERYMITGAKGETAEIKVSQIIGDIKTESNEFCSLYELNIEISVD